MECLLRIFLKQTPIIQILLWLIQPGRKRTETFTKEHANTARASLQPWCPHTELHEVMLEFECGKEKDVSREQMLHKLAITHGKQRGQCSGSPQHHAEWSWMNPRGEKCHNPSTPCLQRLIKHKVNPEYLVSLSTARKWIKTPGKTCFISKWGLPWGVRAAHKSHSFPLFGLQLLVNAGENPVAP